MHTITIHAAKGGSGRTTAVMALASGFLALDKRVMVMDCTSQTSRGSNCKDPSTLQTWLTAMEACRLRSPQLELVECPTDESVEDALAAAATRGFDIVLIDTQVYPEDAVSMALAKADLIVVPATGPIEARFSSQSINERFDCPEHIIGLMTGHRHGAAEAAEIRSAFGTLPAFHSELPGSEALAEQILHGDVAHFTSMLSCKSGQPGYARYREAQAAWSEVIALTIELQWALRGLRLEAFEGDNSPFSYIRKSVA
ncbi:AAA family ATPase [Ruegeria sp. HKCCA4812]|uniref:AAA family ATPase n=1 Tax=Ruegeria sp. HKCCA4812 TaxID=2682993 RepID=UPI0014893F45|nr:AAA family ATPase [Ruegeria sp. HKCCA4812]